MLTTLASGLYRITIAAYTETADIVHYLPPSTSDKVPDNTCGQTIYACSNDKEYTHELSEYTLFKFYQATPPL